MTFFQRIQLLQNSYLKKNVRNKHVFTVLGETRKLIGNTLQISAVVGKIKLEVSSWNTFDLMP